MRAIDSINKQISTATAQYCLLVRHEALAERPFTKEFDILRTVGDFDCELDK